MTVQLGSQRSPERSDGQRPPDPRAGRITRRAQGSPFRRAERRIGALLVSPTLLVILLVTLLPVADTVYLSLHHASVQQAGQYSGLANYRFLFHDPAFRTALKNTAIFGAVAVALELVIGMAVAVVLNQVFGGRAILRAAVLLPWAFPLAIAAVLARLMLQDQTGIVSYLLTKIGVSHGPILSSHAALLVAAIVVDVWTSTPFIGYLLLAGMQSIPPSVMEAATVDGASPWQKFVHITLPLLRPAILVAVLFRTLQAWAVYDLFYVMGLNQIDSLSTYVYRDVRVSELQFAPGAAAAVVVFGTSIVIALAFIKGVGRREPA